MKKSKIEKIVLFIIVMFITMSSVLSQNVVSKNSLIIDVEAG